MKEFGSPEARSAAVFCTVLECRRNSSVIFQKTAQAKATARIHEGGRHEAVIVYLDKNYPLSREDAIKIEEMAGIPLLNELIS